MNPKISIICVTLNASEFIERCLESIFSQKYRNIELIIQDGGSTDGTLDILSKWSNKIDYLESAQDEGIYDAMNKALKRITGDWVYFIGSDDIVLPDFSEMIQSDLKEKDVVYYGNVMVRGKKYRGRFSEFTLAKKNISHQAILYPAEIFKHYNFAPQYVVCADYELNLKIYRKYKFKYRERTIAIFNHTGTSSIVQDNLFESEKIRMIQQYLSPLTYLMYKIRLFYNKCRHRE